MSAAVGMELTPCPMTADALAEWCRRSPYTLVWNDRYAEGLALTRDQYSLPAQIGRPVVAEGEQARRFPAMVEAARQAALGRTGRWRPDARR